MRTTIITGASGDIGRQIALDFASAGYGVIVHFHKGEDIANEIVENIIRNKGEAYPFSADLSKFSDAQRLFEFSLSKFRKIDILVNNAGVSLVKMFQDVTEDEWKYLFDVNVGSVFNCSSVVSGHMIRNHSGKIINISSIWGLVGGAMEVHYSASKAAIIGFTKALAKELGPSGICVNCVAPGAIDTKMNNFDFQTREKIIEETPLCRVGIPSDISKVVLFLASSDANYITGEVINANGGWNLR